MQPENEQQQQQISASWYYSVGSKGSRGADYISQEREKKDE